MASDTVRPLAAALDEFKAGLTPEHRAQLQSLNTVPNTAAALRFTAELDDRNSQRRSRGVASRMHDVLQSVQQFSTIVGTFSQSHADIAALIWGSVKFTILLASNFASFFDKLSECFMRLRSLCPRCEIYEALFRGFPTLQSALVDFYTTVVHFCAKAVRIIERKGAVQLVKTFWKPFEREFGDLEESLERHSKNVNEEIALASEQAADQGRQLQLAERKDAAIFRKYVRGKVERIGKGEQEWRLRVSERNERAKKQRLLDQLSTYDYISMLKQSRKKRYGTTSKWLSKTLEYTTWLADTQSSVFWLSGILGSGKTVVTAAIIDDLICRQPTMGSAVSFFFCQYNLEESLRARTILGCLMRQCLSADSMSRDVQNRLTQLFAGPSPDAEELAPLLTDIVTESRSYFFVIDGLDELSLAERDVVFTVFKQLIASSHSSIKIFFASRDDLGVDIRKRFSALYHRAMSCPEASADITSYVEKTIEERVKNKDLAVGNPALILDIVNALVQGAQGMFLWVAFQLQDICAQTCDDDIRRAIKDLPKDLPQTYERALTRVVEDKKTHIAEKVYRWVAAAKRPLSLEELRDAIAVEPCQPFFKPERLVNNVEQIIPWCRNLAVLDEEESIVQFAHYTVKDFLTSPGDIPATSRFHFQLSEVDRSIGEVCVTYLDFNDFKRQLIKPPNHHIALDPGAVIATSLSASRTSIVLKSWMKFERLWERLPRKEVDVIRHLSSTAQNNKTDVRKVLQTQYPFLAYASEHWLLHTSNFTDETQTWNTWGQLINAKESLAARPWTYDEWANGNRVITQYILDHNHLALLAFRLVSKMAQPLTEREKLLRSASKRGYSQLVEVVLTSTTFEDIVLNNSLWVAARSGHLDVVERLLTAGADVNAAAAYQGHTALEAAAEGGHLDVVERLLTAGADVNAAAAYHDHTALQAAAEGGHLDVVERLLTAGADVNAAAAYQGHTALQAAALGGHLDVVERLLTAGADVNVMNYDDQTALHVAVIGGHFSVVERLKRAGAR